MTITKIPALSGNQLNRLLIKNGGWIEHGHRRHGVAKKKRVGNKTRVTIIPKTNDPLTPGTLSAILGPKQTGIGRKGLLALLRKK